MNQYDLISRFLDEKRRPKGKAGRSMLYEGDTIYSYGKHWPIARLVTLADSGRRVCLLHDVSRYGSATDRHTSSVRWSALRRPLPVLSVEHDLFNTVTDEATLAKAEHLSAERVKDRAYEARLARNERARREREYNADNARSALEDLLGVDLDDLSNSAVVKLRNLLLGVPGNNFLSCSNRRSGERRGGLAQQYPVLAETITAVIGQDPTVLKRPGELLTLVENFKLLAA